MNASNQYLKKSRTIPLFAKGDEDGKLFRCWNCGQICNQERDALGGSESPSGVQVDQYLEPSIATPGSAILLEGSVGASKLTLDGSMEDIIYAFHPDPEGSQGCPFCHSLNWRGDY